MKQRTIISLFVVCGVSFVDGNFYRSSGGVASIGIEYEIPVVSVGGVVSKARGLVGLQLTNQSTPQNLAAAARQDLANDFKRMSDDELLKARGNAAYGRDPNKWQIMLNGKPYESYGKETVLVSDDNKMDEIYRNHLKAVYVASSADETKQLQTDIAKKQAEIQQLQARLAQLHAESK